jgi:uncharacterized membrane protein (DUF485 family)
MFAVYAVIYAGFVIINTVAPALMGVIVFGGVDLAVAYGFGLIVLAILLGLLYSFLCSRLESQAHAAGTGEAS